MSVVIRDFKEVHTELLLLWTYTVSCPEGPIPARGPFQLGGPRQLPALSPLDTAASDVMLHIRR